MKFKKVMAAALAAVSLGTMAVTASAKCEVDYSTGAITWTFDGDTNRFMSGYNKTTRYFTYSDSLFKLTDNDGEITDESKAQKLINDKDLLIKAYVGNDATAVYEGDDKLYSVYTNGMYIHYKAPSDGTLAVWETTGSATIADATERIVECTKGDVATLSAESKKWSVFKVTFTPNTSTQYYTFNTADQSGAAFSKLSLTNTMYGDTAKAEYDLGMTVTGGADIIGAIENVPESADLAVTIE